MVKKVEGASIPKNKKEIYPLIVEKLNAIDNEIKKDVTPAIVASFGFIIALVWRDAIKEALDHFLRESGLFDQAYLYNFVSAFIVTIIVIVIMILVTNYGRKTKQKKIENMVSKEINLLEKEK